MQNRVPVVGSKADKAALTGFAPMPRQKKRHIGWTPEQQRAPETLNATQRGRYVQYVRAPGTCILANTVRHLCHLSDAPDPASAST
jgi:hypothetical protein